MIVVLMIVAPESIRSPPPSNAELPAIRLSRITGIVRGMLNIPPPPSALLATSSTRSSVIALLLRMPPPRSISWLPPAVESPPVIVMSLDRRPPPRPGLEHPVDPAAVDDRPADARAAQRDVGVEVEVAVGRPPCRRRCRPAGRARWSAVAAGGHARRARATGALASWTAARSVQPPSAPAHLPSPTLASTASAVESTPKSAARPRMAPSAPCSQRAPARCGDFDQHAIFNPVETSWFPTLIVLFFGVRRAFTFAIVKKIAKYSEISERLGS